MELRFDGVYQDADFWLNGQHLGFHPYGYTSFAFDVTSYLNPVGHENVLAVRVNNSGQNSRWYSGSGIYRHTWLTITGPVRIPLWGVYVTTPVGQCDHDLLVRIEVPVANHQATADAGIGASGGAGSRWAGGRSLQIEASAARRRTNRQLHGSSIPVSSPRLWSPETLTYTALGLRCSSPARPSTR